MAEAFGSSFSFSFLAAPVAETFWASAATIPAAVAAVTTTPAAAK